MSDTLINWSSLKVVAIWGEGWGGMLNLYSKRVLVLQFICTCTCTCTTNCSKGQKYMYKSIIQYNILTLKCFQTFETIRVRVVAVVVRVCCNSDGF